MDIVSQHEGREITLCRQSSAEEEEEENEPILCTVQQLTPRIAQVSLGFGKHSPGCRQKAFIEQLQARFSALKCNGPTKDAVAEATC